MEQTWTEEARDKDMRAHMEWAREPISLSLEEMEREIRRLRKVIGTARVRLTRIKDHNSPNIYAEACHARELLGCGMGGGEGSWP